MKRRATLAALALLIASTGCVKSLSGGIGPHGALEFHKPAPPPTPENEVTITVKAGEKVSYHVSASHLGTAEDTQSSFKIK